MILRNDFIFCLTQYFQDRKRKHRRFNLAFQPKCRNLSGILSVHLENFHSEALLARLSIKRLLQAAFKNPRRRQRRRPSQTAFGSLLMHEMKLMDLGNLPSRGVGLSQLLAHKITSMKAWKGILHEEPSHIPRHFNI